MNEIIIVRTIKYKTIYLLNKELLDDLKQTFNCGFKKEVVK